MTNRFHYWYVAIALTLVTFLSRGPFTYLSPISDALVTEYSLTEAQRGILLSLPTFVLGIFSSVAAKANSRFGVVLTMFLSLVLIAFGIVVREYFSLFSYGAALYIIYVGTTILTVGLAFMSVLYPAFINTFFRDRIGLMSALSTTNLTISAVAGSAMSLTLISHGWTWREIGSIWLVLTLLIILYYLPVFKFTAAQMEQVKFANSEKKSQTKAKPMHKQAVAWVMAILIGLESANFYFMLSYYPIFSKSFLSENELNFVVNLYQLVGLPTSFGLPILMMRYPRAMQYFTIIGALLFALSLSLLFFVTNYYLVILLAIVFGIEAGVILSAFYTLLATKTTDPQTTSRLAGFSSTVGYIITGFFLLAFGVLIQLAGGEFWLAIAVTIAYNVLIPISAYLMYKLDVDESHLKTQA